MTSLLPRSRRRLRTLLIPAALLSVVAFCVGANGQALAAARPATQHFSLQLAASSQDHVSTTVPMSAGDCAAMRRSLAVSHPGAPKANCEIGIGLAAVNTVPTRTCKKTGTWTTCYDKGTICFGDRPLWGGPNHSFSCRGEAYVSVDGRWKYHSPNNKKVWLLGQVSCPYAYFGAGANLSRKCFSRNNGHPILTMESTFVWSGSFGGVSGGGNGYIAIYAHDNGKITLYGAWNKQ
ncbi:MAG: hypothetical protein ACM3ML_00835 [Micromonosporaceae bacterium]